MKLFKLSLAILLGSLAFSVYSNAQADANRFFELRIYHTNEGKLPALKKRFADHTMAIFDRLEMEDFGYWEPMENTEGLLIYFLEFESREDRDSKWKLFVNDPAWKSAYAESIVDGNLVNAVDSLFLETTDYSPNVETGIVSPGQVFEFRSYIASEGNLANLDARFRDATIDLFAQFGATNVCYWHLSEDQEDSDRRLVYLLAHDSIDARNASFSAFGSSSVWEAARTASEEHAGGALTDSVDSEFWVPIKF